MNPFQAGCGGRDNGTRCHEECNGKGAVTKGVATKGMLNNGTRCHEEYNGQSTNPDVIRAPNVLYGLNISYIGLVALMTHRACAKRPATHTVR